MESFYTCVLPQRYLANFPINQWKTAEMVLLGRDNEVVTEIAQGGSQITKDGRVIASGDKIFIPWDPHSEEKIYHWNSGGGSTTWDLPESWRKERQVWLFTLADEGRTQKKAVPVKDHKVTIDARPMTAYVIYKGTASVRETNITAYDWSTGSPVKDMGFESHTFGYAWEKSSSSGATGHITYVDNAPAGSDERDYADNRQGNTHIQVQGSADAVLTQTMTGLEPGQSYSASVFAEASDGRRVFLQVTTSDGKIVSNFTFVQPEGETTAVIRLEAGKGDGKTSFANFDNVRVTPVGLSDQRGHDYFEDFENVDQEFGPFVCLTKVTQDHLSENNGEWSKDVIEGRYSLKIRGGT